MNSNGLMERHRASFKAKSAEGREYLIHILVRAETNDEYRLVSAENQPVIRLKKGMYRIVPLNLQVSTEDPEAP